MDSSTNESDWAADRKVGFAMGILIIGIVAALFFRNEPLAVEEIPAVDREDLIDSRLKDRNVAVYADEPSDGATVSSQPWTRLELLSEYEKKNPALPLPIGTNSEEPVKGEPADLAAVLQQTRPKPERNFSPPTIAKATVPRNAANGSPDSEQERPNPPVFEIDKTLADPDSERFTEYTIRYGDTLSGIADRLLGSPRRYRDIYEANRDRMASPDRLQVGTAIRIPRL